MAHSFSGGLKIISDLISHPFSNALLRRAYRAGTIDLQRVVFSAATEGVPPATKNEKEEKSREKPAWVPDPVTGYYRPENYVDEIDPVDLRAKLLKPRKITNGTK